MKNFILFLSIFLISCNSFAQDKLYLLFEFMKVDNEQEREYWETESFWEKIHEQRVKNGDIIGWDLWSLQPGGEDQGFQYLTVNLYNDPVKMFEGSGDFMKAVKAAYPDMSEEDLKEKFNSTVKSRDLAVRIYLEEIATTNGDFEMVVGTVANIDMMKATFGNRNAYEKAEMEVFQPIHQKQVDAGSKGSWGLLRFMSPVGSETYASHITVNMFKDYDHVFNGSSNTAWAELTAEQVQAVNDGIATRDMKFVYMAKLVKMVR